MKKLFLLLIIVGGLPLHSLAQDDDLYFVPGKTERAAKAYDMDETPAYYRGTSRSIDEYNRAGKFRSYYQKIGVDSLGNDIVTFRNGFGVGPDSSYIDTAFVYPGSARFEDDYEYTQRMSRWDDFYDPWYYGYGPWRRGWYAGRYDPWYYGYGYGGWYDPWYYGYNGWYDPWYGGYGWYGPYRRGWYAGWYAPWYYGYGNWYGGGYVRVNGGNPRGLTGDRTWSFNSRGTSTNNNAFGRSMRVGSNGNTSTYTSRSNSNRSFGGRVNSVRSTRSYDSNNGSFGNNTRTTPSYGGSGMSSGGRFGGGHTSGGGSFGGGNGTRSTGGGGGHFGAGRR